MSPDLRILTFTSLYPSAARPRHGIFVESRLQRLLARGGVQARVVAPVPWFPLSARSFGEYGRIGATPRAELRGEIEVRYPRYLMLPRVGMLLQPAAMARCGLREMVALKQSGFEFDLIDAHYLYPDGVAAAQIARKLRRPLVISARGSDVNLIAKLPGTARMIRQAIDDADAVIAVSEALRRSLIDLGVKGERITVLRNGVDSELFSTVDKEEARQSLGLPSASTPVVASVGNLVDEKGHDLALKAAAAIERLHLVIVGRGPKRPSLVRLAQELAISRRVTFLEEMPQARLRWLYSAADVLVLASAREGWPNVLLESIACGTPTVAFDVGGVSEILRQGGGIIVRGERTAKALAAAIRSLIAEHRDPENVRTHALKFAWEPVLDAQLTLYRRVVQCAATRVPQLIIAR